MKRLLCFLCILSLITSTGLVNAANYTVPQPRSPLRPPVKSEEAGQEINYYEMTNIMTDDASFYDAPETFVEIETRSDIILEGRLTGESEQKLFRTSDGLYVKYGFTFSKLKIDRVYQGDVNVGDIITVLEPYYVMDDIIYHANLYYPSDNGKSYIWFLVDRRPDFAHYSLAMRERGRFPVLNTNARSANQLDSLSRQDLNLSPSGEAKDEEIYRDILEDVVAKYMSGSGG